MNGLAFTTFKTATIKEVKVCDIVKAISKSPEFSFAALPKIIEIALDSMTFETAIDLIISLAEMESEEPEEPSLEPAPQSVSEVQEDPETPELSAEVIFATLKMITVDKLEFSRTIKANALGLPLKLVLSTNDEVSMAVSLTDKVIYKVNAKLELDFAYGTFGEDVFTLPAVAD